MRFWRIALVTLVLGSAVGCTSDGGAGPSGSPAQSSSSASATSLPPSSAAPTPKSSAATVPTSGPNVRPGEKPPVLTALGHKNSRAGAADFSLFWFQALDWGYATTNSALAKKLFLPQCSDCARLASAPDQAGRAAHHFSGGRLSVSTRRVVVDDFRHPGTTVLDVAVSAEPLKTLDSKNRIVSTEPGIGKIVYRLWLAWSANSWAVLDIKEALTK